MFTLFINSKTCRGLQVQRYKFYPGAVSSIMGFPISIMCFPVSSICFRYFQLSVKKKQHVPIFAPNLGLLEPSRGPQEPKKAAASLESDTTVVTDTTTAPVAAAPPAVTSPQVRSGNVSMIGTHECASRILGSLGPT